MVVFITVGNLEEAEKIGRSLVEERLAACANIIGPIKSVYRWKEKVEEAEEYLLIVKTVSERLGELIARVKSLHSYSLPEVIAVKVEGGSARYLSWLEESIRRSN